MKTGLVLEGGGVRGIYVAGVLDVFMEHDLTFDGVIGVSAGAIHGCSYLSNQKGRSLRYYENHCNDPRFMSFRSWLTTGDIVGVDFCYHEIPDNLDLYDYASFSNSGIPFYATCSNIETGKAEHLLITDMRTQVDYMRASASLPYFSRIVEINGKKYLDGGCTDSIPVDAFRSMGYQKNVVILTRDIQYRKKPEFALLAKLVYRKYPKFIQALLDRHINYNKTVEYIIELEKAGEVFVIRPTEPLTIGRMEKDPKEVRKTYDLGRCDAKRQMDALKAWLQTTHRQ